MSMGYNGLASGLSAETESSLSSKTCGGRMRAWTSLVSFEPVFALLLIHGDQIFFGYAFWRTGPTDFRASIYRPRFGSRNLRFGRADTRFS